LNSALIFLKLKEGVKYDSSSPLVATLKKEGTGSEAPPEFSDSGILETGGSPVDELPYKLFENLDKGLGEWSIETEGMNPEAIEDILILTQYSASGTS
jgi:hypothetical protein